MPPSADPPVVLRAPAKLTLRLQITGVRADGFHLLDAEMVTLDLFDVLTIDPAGDGLEVVDVRTGRTRSGAPEDLVRRALASVDRRAGIRLEKRIPPGAGLGGGSADAAAVLRWAGATDLVRAGELGADIPFCVVGGRARVTGIGEVVEPLAFEPRVLTLVTPRFGCSTPAVYRRWDELGGPRGDQGNDLEPAALDVEPRLAAVRDALGDATGSTPRLAGSGSTWFVEGDHPGDGRVVVRTTPAGWPSD
jgi:4-diphosphocytidyl-2-C-methyl-D-erythritol kinase